MTELPIGCIFCYPTPICPDGFLPCDGRELSKTAYCELYKIIRDTWGDTPTTFFLPDLRGQFVRGWDDGDGVDPDSGADSVRNFGSEQTDAFQGHGHELYVNGELSESVLHYDAKKIEYGTNTFSSNESISFNSVLTPSEQQTHIESLKKMANSFYGLRFMEKMRLTLSHIAGIGIKHRHELPEIKVKDAICSTFQKVRTSVETRPKNIALMYCIKVK